MQHRRMRYAHDILAKAASQRPDHVAVVDQRGTCLYRDLADAADLISRTLILKGVTQGSVVGISMVDARSFLATLFGVLQAGCIAVPVAPNLSESERTHVIQDSLVQWVISANPFEIRSSLGDVVIDESSTINNRHLTENEMKRVRDRFPDAAVMRHTSGTTGQSKGVVLSHRAVLERVTTSRDLLEVTDDDVVLIQLSLSYHFIASAMACVLAGATIIDSTDIHNSIPIAENYLRSSTIIYASPNHYEHMIRDSRLLALPSVRRAISASALLPKRTADRFLQKFNLRLTQVYGIIEVGLPLWNTFESVEPTALGTCRTPYECEVVSTDGLTVPVGQVGELRIRGPGLFSGYLLGGGAVYLHPSNEWFYTGDLVTRDELGLILYRGRAKNVIAIDGHSIFPEEIEEVLKLAPDIEAVRVSVSSNSQFGNRVIAEIVSSNPSQQSTKSWRELCQRELSEYKIPHEFRLVESLPRTGSGKISRHSQSTF